MPNMRIYALPLSILTLCCAQLAFAHGMSEAEKQAIAAGGNLQYLWIGATHMLSGYDHLAFVFGIIFFLKSLPDVIKYVTAFTIGHSITLITATFYAIQLNYMLIDAVIALSVCYIAFANLDGFRKYLNINPPNMLWMIVGFGLIHGFGLSTRLQELPLNPDALLMNIISFNIGIELGQIIALAIMLLLIAAWRKRSSFQTFSLLANYALMLAGGLLFLMQMHDYTHANEAKQNTASPLSAKAPANTASVQQKTITILIPARGELEYKVFIHQGAALEYTWETSGKALFFDFHGDPKADTTGYFESYQKGTLHQSSGTFIAPFTGNHGWYWKNTDSEPVEIHLTLQGSYQLITKHDQSYDVEDLGFDMDIASDFPDLAPITE